MRPIEARAEVLPQRGWAQSIAALLARGGRQLDCTIEGDSMAPTLLPGSRVRLRFETGQAGAGFQRGELVAFLGGAGLVVHRLVHVADGRRGASLVTRGDARTLPDPPLAPGGVLARVVAVERDGAWQAPAPLPPSGRGERLLRWLALASLRLVRALDRRAAARIAKLAARGSAAARAALDT